MPASTMSSFGKIDAMTFRYSTGFSIRQILMTPAPYCSKSLQSSSMNFFCSRLRVPFGRPSGQH